MERGEIRWYSFKKPNKKRPVIILTRSSIIPFINEITVAPVTSVIRDIPSEVIMTESDGMLKTSAINFDHIQTISKRKIGTLITRLAPDRQQEVDKAIKFALQIDEVYT